eukprot:10328633-Alexandrium_andersonii.AAC.1
MTWAGWVFHPGVFPSAAGAEAPGVESGVWWYHPVCKVASTHAQARCPGAAQLVMGGRPSAGAAPAAALAL